MAKKKNEVQEEIKKEIKLVPMIKGDLKADVHPDEVENYALGGYELIK